MGMFSLLKLRKANTLYSNGDVEGALKVYEEAVESGLKDVRQLLTYSVLLIRHGDFQKARELLVKIQKLSITDDQRAQLLVNYASCVYKMGEIDKGIELLERQHAKQPNGMLYETLGYLYVEKGDYEKAVAFNTEALEYDDEDPITLDNLAQAYYRLGNEKEKAKPYSRSADYYRRNDYT